MSKEKDRMEFEDVYSDSSAEQQTYARGRKPLEQREIVYANKFQEFMCRNNKKNAKRILICIIVFLLLFVVALAAMFINDKFNLLGANGGKVPFTGDENYSEDFNDAQFDAMHEVSDAASLDDLLMKWHNNGGELMRQDYVVNVLLVGIDGKNGVQNGGNSDSLILVSINKKTQTINLVSFMRDSRTYYEVNGNDYWAKVNATYSRGGAAATVKTLENDYKVDIDFFVAVDFTTFPKLVDALGGVTVEIQQYEQEYINRTTSAIKKIPTYGKVKLDGAQALVYSRIRHSDADSDVSRTRRQRTVIMAIIKSAKGASIGQLNNAIDTLLPYLSTNCTKSAILKYAAQALSQGWMDYEIKQMTMPDEETRADAKINGASLWVVDYPAAAQKVQKMLYGTTNIELSVDRVSALDFVSYNPSYTQGGNSSGDGNSDSGNGYETTTAQEYAETTTRRHILDFFTTTAPAQDSGAEDAPPQDGGNNSDGEQVTTAVIG